MNDARRSEAERCVLGCGMFSAKGFRKLAEHFDGEWFHEHHHVIIWGAMVSMWRAGVRQPDLVLLKNALGPNLKAVGGVEYLAQCAETVGTAANFDYYAEQVKDAWRDRTVLARFSKIKAAIDSGDRDQFRSLVGAFSDSLYPGDTDSMTVADAVAALRVAPGWSGRGVSTGIDSFDRASRSGGLDPGEYGLLAAASGRGKTLLGLQVSLNAARDGKPVVFVTMELPTPRLTARLACMVSGFRDKDAALASGFGAEWDESMDELAGLPIEFIDMAGAIEGKAEPRDVISRIEWASAKPEMFVVDFLQRMRPKQAKTVFDAMDEVAALFASFTTRTGIPGWVLSQEGEAGDREGRIAGGEEPSRLSAHWLQLLYEKGDKGKQDKHYLFCRKMREGKSLWKQPVYLDTQWLTWRECL